MIRKRVKRMMINCSCADPFTCGHAREMSPRECHERFGDQFYDLDKAQQLFEENEKLKRLAQAYVRKLDAGSMNRLASGDPFRYHYVDYEAPNQEKFDKVLDSLRSTKSKTPNMDYIYEGIRDQMAVEELHRIACVNGFYGSKFEQEAVGIKLNVEAVKRLRSMEVITNRYGSQGVITHIVSDTDDIYEPLSANVKIIGDVGMPPPYLDVLREIAKNTQDEIPPGGETISDISGCTNHFSRRMYSSMKRGHLASTDLSRSMIELWNEIGEKFEQFGEVYARSRCFQIDLMNLDVSHLAIVTANRIMEVLLEERGMNGVEICSREAMALKHGGSVRYARTQPLPPMADDFDGEVLSFTPFVDRRDDPVRRPFVPKDQKEYRNYDEIIADLATGEFRGMATCGLTPDCLEASLRYHEDRTTLGSRGKSLPYPIERIARMNKDGNFATAIERPRTTLEELISEYNLSVSILRKIPGVEPELIEKFKIDEREKPAEISDEHILDFLNQKTELVSSIEETLAKITFLDNSAADAKKKSIANRAKLYAEVYAYGFDYINETYGKSFIDAMLVVNVDETKIPTSVRPVLAQGLIQSLLGSKTIIATSSITHSFCHSDGRSLVKEIDLAKNRLKELIDRELEGHVYTE